MNKNIADGMLDLGMDDSQEIVFPWGALKNPSDNEQASGIPNNDVTTPDVNDTNALS